MFVELLKLTNNLKKIKYNNQYKTKLTYLNLLKHINDEVIFLWQQCGNFRMLKTKII